MKGNEVKVIQVLLENKTKDVNINQLAKLLKKDYKNTHNIVKRLEKIQLITLEQFGKAYKVKLINKPHPLIIEAEYQRREILKKKANFRVIINDFKKINEQLIVLLFGSHAKGTNTKHSDIDLLIITENEEKISSMIRLYPLDIHPTYVPMKYFIDMLKSREFTVVSEAIKNNYIFVGIEDYYRLLENVGY